MKRVRTEQIQMAVSCYLKRRQYVDSDGPLKQGLRLSQTAEEMAANLTGTRGPALGVGRSVRDRSHFSGGLGGHRQMMVLAFRDAIYPSKPLLEASCRNPSRLGILSGFVCI